jgi:hypothetical protein
MNNATANSGNTLPLGVMTLSNNPTLSLASNANYNLSLTGLHGGGTITGTNAVTVTGIVSPGDPQLLTVNNLTLGSAATYEPVIVTGTGSNSAGAGTNYDQINVTGAAALAVNAASTLDILDSTYTPAAGDEFFLVNESATSSAFGSVEFNNGSPVTPDGNGYYDVGTASFALSYTGNETTGALTGGHDIVLDVVSVPEPSVLGMFAIGAMGLLARRRNRRRKIDQSN